MSINWALLLFYAWFALLGAILVWLAAILSIHFFVPKAMLRTYFRKPYFSPAEIELFTGFPFAYIRTAMFMRLAGWPESGKRRGLTAAHELAPRWFQRISRVYIRMLLLLGGLVIALLIISFITFELLGA